MVRSIVSRVAFALALALAGCAQAPAPVEGPALLSEWGLFSDLPGLVPADGVVEYDLSAPLFSDHASKHRLIRLPPGTVAEVGPDGRFVFPIGTVLVKTFGFRDDVRDSTSPERILETRLLERTEDGWVPHVYLWNDEGTDAMRASVGAAVAVELTDPAGERVSFTYRVPNLVQCGNCHGGTGDVEPIGPRLEELDHVVVREGASVGQIDWLLDAGVLEAGFDRDRSLPPYFDESAGTLDERARAYLEANCAHCHRDGGAADASGLYLDAERIADATLGICKNGVAIGPGSGGRCYDIVPGDADASILVYRMSTDAPGRRMPESGQTLVHDEGVALVRAWIDAMAPVDCGPTTSCPESGWVDP